MGAFSKSSVICWICPESQSAAKIKSRADGTGRSDLRWRLDFSAYLLKWYLTWWKWKSHLPNQQNIGGFLFAPWRIKTVQGKFIILSAELHVKMLSTPWTLHFKFILHEPSLEHTHTQKHAEWKEKRTSLNSRVSFFLSQILQTSIDPQDVGP